MAYKQISNDYQIRYSKKAKHLRLSMSGRGLEVILPKRLKSQFSIDIIADFIQQKQKWIDKQKRRFSNLVTQKNVLPTCIHFPALSQIWQVEYQKDHKIDFFSTPDNKVYIRGNINNQTESLNQLRCWLRSVANEYLPTELAKLAKVTGFTFNKVSIRNNTSRWGSCSNKKNISLCCKLLFLPYHLIRYVLLHELCHTKVLTHGKAFWNLMGEVDACSLQHAKELKKMIHTIPAWV